MEKVSIVPELVAVSDVRFFDDNLQEVTICKQLPYKPIISNRFQQPFLLIDNFEKKKKEVEIKNIYDVEEIERLGYRLVSVPCNSKIRNYPNQKSSYILEDVNNPIPKATPLNKVPKEHVIEFDIINRLIRIKGRNAWPYSRANNASEWSEVDNE